MPRGKRQVKFVCVNYNEAITLSVPADTREDAIVEFSRVNNGVKPDEVIGPVHERGSVVASLFVKISDVKNLSFTKDIIMASYKGHPCSATGLKSFTDDQGITYGDNETYLVTLTGDAPEGVRRPRMGKSSIVHRDSITFS